MGGQKSKQNTTASSTIMEGKRRMVENYLIIWVDSNIDMTSKDNQETLVQLRSIVNEVYPCTTAEQCIEKLQENNEETSFVISSGALGEHLVPNIHGMPKLGAIYIFCANKQWHDVWAKNWTKIKGVHTSIEPIYEALIVTVKQCNQDQITVNIVSTNGEDSSENFNQREPCFTYKQIFKEILVHMEHGQQAIQDLVKFCQQYYQGNTKEMKLINEFEHTYRPTLAISWYIRKCFTYKMLNRALRTHDGNIITRMGFYLCDVHRQIEQLHKQQVSLYMGKAFQVYRGQGLLTADFEKLSQNQGGLISFNNFLSTSKNRDVSLSFAKDALGTTDMVGILLQITIDPMVSSTPFAFIQEVSYYKDEEEILFSMHTVFRIGEIRKIDRNRPLYEVDLKLISDDDQQLRRLTDCLRQESLDSTGWYRIGKLLLKIGRFDEAEELYTILLEQASNDSDKVNIYYQLGWLKDDQGQYKEAVSFYEKSLQIKQETLQQDHPTLACIYSKFGQVYNNMRDYSKALQFYELTLEINKETLPLDHRNLAISYSKIGQVYNNMDDYSKAFEFYEKSHKILERALPPNHPSLAISYNDIGLVYKNMGNYSKALECYQRSHKILEKTIPPNYSHLAACYSNIGQVYKNMGDYSKALEFYEKDLEITKKTLPSNNPDLAGSYYNFGSVYENIGEYSMAKQSYERAVEIAQLSLPLNHSRLQLYKRCLLNINKTL